MINPKTLKAASTLCFLGFLAACTPSQEKALTLGADTSSIIGGTPVEAEDSISKSTVAIVAYVTDKEGKEKQFICTGSLLTSNVVLTAAHCVPQVGPQEEVVDAALYVVFNKDLRSVLDTDFRLVTDAVVHEGYGKFGPQGEDSHDIALLKFAGKKAEGYEVAKILTDETLLKPGTKVTLAGYGLTETDGVTTSSDDRLRKTEVEVAGHFGRFEVVVDQSQGKGACHGDSGGPAFIEIDGTQYVWGLTSRGSGKDGVDDCSLMSIYTKVKSEATFIRSALMQLYRRK